MHIEVTCPHCEANLAAKVEKENFQTVQMCCYDCYSVFLITPIRVITPIEVKNPVLFSFCYMGGPPCSILQEV